MNVALLAYGYVRQNRWLLLMLGLWPWFFVALMLFVGEKSSLEEYGVLVVQEAFYGIAIAGFSSTAALHNEQRSRRMQGVLAKAVSRAEYLLGFAAGITLIVLVFGLNMLLATVVAARLVGGSAQPVVAYVLTVIVSALLVASLGLMFAAAVHPVFAAICMSVASVLPLVAVRHVHEDWAALLPTLPIFVALSHNPLMRGEWTVSGSAIAMALIEAALCILVGGWLLERRDVTVAVE